MRGFGRAVVRDRGIAGRVVAGFDAVLVRPAALRRSLVELTGLGVAYAAAIALLATGGGTAGSTPWLAIPQQEYFAVEPWFTAPVIVLGAILAAAVGYLLAHALDGTGTFDTTLVVLVRATCLATLVSLVPDFGEGLVTTLRLVDGARFAADLLRPSPARTFLWTYLTLYTLAFLVLYPAAMRSAHRTSWSKAALTGVIAFVVYQGVLAIFIR